MVAGMQQKIEYTAQDLCIAIYAQNYIAHMH